MLRLQMLSRRIGVAGFSDGKSHASGSSGCNSFHAERSVAVCAVSATWRYERFVFGVSMFLGKVYASPKRCHSRHHQLGARESPPVAFLRTSQDARPRAHEDQARLPWWLPSGREFGHRLRAADHVRSWNGLRWRHPVCSGERAARSGQNLKLNALGTMLLFVKTSEHYVGITWDGVDSCGDRIRGGAVFKVGKGHQRGFIAGLERLTGRRAVNADLVESPAAR
jgi:hypothetical protein